MKKVYPLLFISVLIFCGCLDPLSIFDFNDEETVNLWGVDYSIENTTELYLLNSGLTGDIPSEIGNLTNLTGFYLQDNQLSGIIPDEICNQGDSSPGLSNNQLCPPYPSCIENNVGYQDTSGCD